MVFRLTMVNGVVFLGYILWFFWCFFPSPFVGNKNQYNSETGFFMVFLMVFLMVFFTVFFTVSFVKNGCYY